MAHGHLPRHQGRAMTSCPCGSGKETESCCLPFIHGRSLPRTAEQLMRARYTAHSLGKALFIVSTCHPSIQVHQHSAHIERWRKETQFLRLDILETAKGGTQDHTGMVRFIAWTKEKGRLGGIHEKSTFERFESQWTYRSGEHRKLPMPGPNDPCPCGSGGKFKKCCQA